MEDVKLAEKARDGDVDAYERLVRGHQALAFRTAYLITGDAADAEDATQEAFVKAYNALGSFKAGSAFRPWLLAIVANEARNLRRKTGRRAALNLRLVQESPPSDVTASSPEAVVLEDEKRTELMKVLASLHERDRLVVSYRYFLGLSEEEMAAALGCRRGTIKSRLSRALGRLRVLMAKEGNAG